MGARSSKTDASGILDYLIRSYLVDSGATDTFVRSACERFLKKCKPSSAVIHIADDSVLKATVEGEMELCAINTPNYKGLGLGCPFKTNATVVPKISQELLSLSELFAKQGFKVILDPKGICELYLKDADTNHETRVPIRYDYGKRGFYIDCIMSNTPEHYELLASRISDIKENSNLKRQTALQASLIEQKDLPTVLGLLKGNDMVESCQCSNDDTERIFNFETRHTQTPPNPLQHFETQSKCCIAATKDPLIIRRDLKGNNGGMSFEEAHKLYLHTKEIVLDASYAN